MSKDSILEEFKHFSALIGNDFSLIQGAGGNTSIKLNSGEMLVKASGFTLSDALNADIFCNVDYQRVRENIRESNPDLTSGAFDSSNLLRPSIETSLHAILDSKVVFHAHSLNALSWLVQKNVRKKLNDLLANFNWVWVPYAKPGLELALKCVEKLKEQPNANVILLENHGLVVAGNSPSEVFELLLRVDQTLSLGTRPLVAPDLETLYHLSKEIPFVPARSLLAHQLALSEKNYIYSSGGTLYPDHVVFLGPGVIACNKVKDEELPHLIQGLDYDSYKPILLVKGVGVLVHEAISDAAHVMVDALAAVVCSIPSGVEISYLTKSQEKELMFWEAEVYRKELNKV